LKNPRGKAEVRAKEREGTDIETGKDQHNHAGLGKVIKWARRKINPKKKR